MPSSIAASEIDINPTPAAYFGAGAAGKLPGIVRGTGTGTGTGTGCDAVVIVTDAVLAATAVVTRVAEVLAEAGVTVSMFAGVHPNPTTGDIAAGAAVVTDAAARHGRVGLVAVGGGSPIDAAKGIALAAVNPQRGRDLDYRSDFRVPALPIVAVPTTAGTGAETNAFGVVTDPQTRRKFYVGHASSLPAAVVLDPDLTMGLPPHATAATGMDALTHALESYLSIRANPWSDGIALQVVRMITANLPRAYADGTDRESRSQMLLAAHMAGIGMATTGLGICHAIGHSIGGRFGVAHGVALTMVLPHVLGFNAASCTDRIADVALAMGVGETSRTARWNAGAAIDAVASLADRLGMTHTMADFGIGAMDFDQIAADALDDEVLANTPRGPDAGDIRSILLAARQ
jgi:alcohol dehydrogenase